MVWYAIALIVYFAVGVVCHVAMIGRQAKYTNTSAIVSLISAALCIWAVVSLAT